MSSLVDEVPVLAPSALPADVPAVNGGEVHAVEEQDTLVAPLAAPSSAAHSNAVASLESAVEPEGPPDDETALQDAVASPPPPPAKPVAPPIHPAAPGAPATSPAEAATNASQASFADVALSEDANGSRTPPPPPAAKDPPPVPTTPKIASSHAAKASLASASMSRTSTSQSQSGTGVDHGNRRSSVASTATVSATGSSSLVSGVLIVSSLEVIAASKEAKKGALKDAVDAALSTLKARAVVDPLVIFEPLRLACATKNTGLQIAALDCIGKLVSYDFFVDAAGDREKGRNVQLDAGEGDVDGEPAEGGSKVPVSEMPLADLITSTVCDCFSPSPVASSSSSSSAQQQQATTPHDTLLLRLLSCLLSLILSTSLAVHQSSLLKAVRTVYNVFLLGSKGTVQTVAQATLGQIVGGVFGRISVEEAVAASSGLLARGPIGTSSGRESRTDLAAVPEAEPVNGRSGEDAVEVEAEVDAQEADPEGEETEREGQTPTKTRAQVLPEVAAPNGTTNGDAVPQVQEDEGPVSLRALESRESFDGGRPPAGAEPPLLFLSTNDLYVKDAFLVFRALCKLSMKPLGAESEKDLKSHAMRSKLLSLHLVLSVLANHLPLFTSTGVVIHSSTAREATPFIQAVKQYLCLALSRNAVSSVNQVFELSCEIFWRCLSGLRHRLKKEIEVLLNEIFLPVMEMKNSTVRQKSVLLSVFGRVAQDPQTLVDIYLNYDCDRASLDNIYERLVNIIAKLGSSQFAPSTEKPPTAKEKQAAESAAASAPGVSLGSDVKFDGATATEATIKRQSLECLVGILRSLVSWAGRGSAGSEAVDALGVSINGKRNSDETRSGEAELSVGGSGLSDSQISRSHTPEISTPVAMDDPSRFENAKQRKTTLLEGIKKFNFKPKRGVAFLIDTGFIRSKEPRDIAKFLLHADGLSKAQIGEYLGEGEPENIATMHAFVDMMDFSDMAFVDALRMFLQSFRLPGEAQKIDRYMLKFAERYTAGNAGVFANADTAYVLAFSVILLNTDAHNPQVKRPMSKPEFVKNNRGIDDGKDIDEALLSSIYDEINANEIRMKDEVEAAGPAGAAPGGIANAIATVGRDLQREAYVWQSEGMANKTEALFRTMVRGQRRGNTRATDQYYSASHFEHVRPMFEVAWMPILAGISGPLQHSDDIEMITLSLDGFKQAIKIVCLFDLELERNAFVTTLAKFTFLNNFGEMKPKNVEAIKALLDIAMVDGNYLKGSWREVLTCVSQLERFQLIAQGVDSQAVPELGRKPLIKRGDSSGDRRSTLARLRNSKPTQEVAQETQSQHITITADMIFSSTPHLSGTAIVDFVQALSDVSWEEIQASGLAEHPRVFCLQKLVEISYYNMNRIRLEWSAIWAILGEHFNQVTCHTNANVSFLALDSLRQLAMRFLEKEELPNFKFQKDFLKPFEYAMSHNVNPDARDMVLQCLHQMLQARVQNLRSGWATMFSVFSAASKVPSERIAVQAFELVQRVNKENFSRVVSYGSFADLTVCITDFCKISKYQRASLQAIEMLKGVIPQMLTCPECPLSHQSLQNGKAKSDRPAADDPMLRFWFPVLFGFYDVIMNGEDLEVRKRALDYLFDTLKKHGETFPIEFWDSVCKNVLFPIFAVLRSRSDVSRFSTQEDMSVWLSTTMIQALRNLVDLFTFYFEMLSPMLDRLLDLLCECICQENDTLARIGTSCLQQLLESNVQKLSPQRWEKIVSTFTHLFKTTTAYQLFDEHLRIPEPEGTPASPDANANPSGFVAPTPLSPNPEPAGPDAAESTKPLPVFSDRKRIFRQIIVKCVLQLLLIETTQELLANEEVYKKIPPVELLRLMASLQESYRFAKRFNADKDLRMDLWKVGFMRVLPNLLRQESTSAATLVKVLLRLYNDERPEHIAQRGETVEQYSPLGLDIIAGYVALDGETQARNIVAWTPVIAEVLQGFCTFEDAPFAAQLPHLYPLATDIMGREMDPVVRESVKAVFVRVGRVSLGIPAAPSAPKATVV